MTLGDVVDKLHDEHCLAHTGATEQTDFTTFAIGLKKVNHLYTGIEYLGAYSEVVKRRSRLVNRTQIVALQRRKVVDGFTDNVKESSLNLIAGGHRNRTAEVVNTYTSLQSVGTFHCHTTHSVLSDVLLHFKNKSGTVGAVNLERSINGRNHIVLSLEGNIDHGADNLSHCSEFIAHLYENQGLYRFIFLSNRLIRSAIHSRLPLP